jgi:NAD/NADP transhydrogenase beta subunit
MQRAAQPEVISPRIKRAKGLFADENLDILSHILDDFIQIPGTSIRFGLDGLVGLIPGLGDVLGGLASTIIVFAAWARGVPYVTVTRMVANIGIEVIIGSIPLIGDAFDIAWKANRRNYALLTGSLQQPRKHTIQSWLFLCCLCVVFFLLMLVPMLIVAWLASTVFHYLFGVQLHFRTWF